MKQKKSVEDYLKVIYILSKQKEVHGADIAGELKVSRPTEDTYERHDTFRRLLICLGVDDKTAAADACEMEHAVSQTSYEALKMLVEKQMEKV